MLPLVKNKLTPDTAARINCQGQPKLNLRWCLSLQKTVLNKCHGITEPGPIFPCIRGKIQNDTLPEFAKEVNSKYFGSNPA
jgi:hypothetical protein